MLLQYNGRPILTVRQAATRCGVSYKTLHNKITGGFIEVVKIEKMLFVFADVLPARLPLRFRPPPPPRSDQEAAIAALVRLGVVTDSRPMSKQVA